MIKKETEEEEIDRRRIIDRYMSSYSTINLRGERERGRGRERARARGRERERGKKESIQWVSGAAATQLDAFFLGFFSKITTSNSPHPVWHLLEFLLPRFHARLQIPLRPASLCTS